MTKTMMSIAVVSFLFPLAGYTATPQEVQQDNTSATVFLQVLDQNGGEIEAGTGFIVSHDGYVVTAAHIWPDKTKGEKLVGTIGQRSGTSYPLQDRDKDGGHDTALWQLPQSAICRRPVVMSSKALDDSEHFVALGFPGTTGLSREPLNVTNKQSPTGFFRTDGQLEPGYSGGPVFGEDGHVIGFVQGGTVSGAHSNDVVPIAPALALIAKNGVAASIDRPQDFPLNCYSKCRSPDHGIEKWTVEQRWTDQTGKENGGEGEAQRCAEVIARDLVGLPPGTRIDLDPGQNDPNGGMWEDHMDHPFDKYVYHCRGTLRSGPIYKESRSRACPLWQ